MPAGRCPQKVARERRAAASASGLCGCCRKRRPEPGKKTCEICIERAVRNKTAARAAAAGLEPSGWCENCQAFGFHRDDCPLQNTARRPARAA